MKAKTEARNLYIVESPLQLLCAYEKIVSQKNVTIVARMNGNQRNDSQLLEVAKALDLNVIKKILRPHYIRRDIIKNFLFIMKLLTRYDNYYFGSYHSKLLVFVRKFLSAEKIVMLDDGVATLLAQKDMAKKGKAYNVFTFFDLTPLPLQKVEKHSFQNVVQFLGVAERQKFGHYFIGQKVVEVGIISSDLYASIVERASLMTEGNKLIYIPHRGESEEILRRLSFIKNLEIRVIDVPIELYFISKESPPMKVYSIMSTALNTLSLLSRRTEFFALVPKSLSKAKVPHISEIVRQLEMGDNINVIYI